MPLQPSRNNAVRIKTQLDTLVNQVSLLEPMAFGTQDLLVLFLSSGMALFALNIYKITMEEARR